MILRISLGIVLCMALVMPPCLAEEAAKPGTKAATGEEVASPQERVAEDQQEGAEGPADLSQLKQLIAELNRRLREMKQQHAAEIEELRSKIEELSREKGKTVGSEQEDLSVLRSLAESEAAKAEEKEQLQEETVFKSGGLSLQALNPEISVAGDMVSFYRHQQGVQEDSGFDFRVLGIHMQAYLDPYTRFKSAVEIHGNGAELGEAYVTRFGLLPDLNLTAGKFRQQFGIVNRWHKHALDQVDFPLALREIFGEDGLNQAGVSLDWTMPSIGDAAQQLTFQVTNGENNRLFGENSSNRPSLLLHYKNFRDLSKDTYLEFGVTSLVGWNDEWPVLAQDGTWRTEHDRLEAWVLGGDFTVLWEPTERMRYRNLEWRSELYYLNRDILDPYDLSKDTVNAWGAYSYVQTKLTRTWDVGVRLDYYEPDSKGYAGLPEIALAPLAVEDSDAYRWQIGPYVNWFQSPFVRFRLEYNHADGVGMEEPEDVVYLQMIFAAGPHKHERY